MPNRREGCQRNKNPSVASRKTRDQTTAGAHTCFWTSQREDPGQAVAEWLANWRPAPPQFIGKVLPFIWIKLTKIKLHSSVFLKFHYSRISYAPNRLWIQVKCLWQAVIVPPHQRVSFRYFQIFLRIRPRALREGMPTHAIRRLRWTQEPRMHKRMKRKRDRKRKGDHIQNCHRNSKAEQDTAYSACGSRNWFRLSRKQQKRNVMWTDKCKFSLPQWSTFLSVLRKWVWNENKDLHTRMDWIDCLLANKTTWN